jgi:hypothetical protein
MQTSIHSNEPMKKLPIGKQEFKGLIEQGCIYVDKTKFLLQLTDFTAPVFLSRPRRFGKSLMLNTFKELFKPIFRALIRNPQEYKTL